MGAQGDFEVEVKSRPCEVTFLYSIDVTSMMTKLQMMKIPRVWPYIVQSHLAWRHEVTLGLNENVHMKWECVCGVGARWLWVVEGSRLVYIKLYKKNQKLSCIYWIIQEKPKVISCTLNYTGKPKVISRTLNYTEKTKSHLAYIELHKKIQKSSHVHWIIQGKPKVI